MIKTLMLFETIPDCPSRFFELEGDYSRFNGIYINEYITETGVKKQQKRNLQDELCKLVYDDETGIVKLTTLSEPTRDWTHFVKCGQIL